MIKVNNISKSFVKSQVISNISATFEKGKTNLIIGQSGSGKTVLMKCLLGLYDVDNGEIFFDEKNFSHRYLWMSNECCGLRVSRVNSFEPRLHEI